MSAIASSSGGGQRRPSTIQLTGRASQRFWARNDKRHRTSPHEKRPSPGHAASSGYFPRTQQTQPAERARTDDACRGRPFRLSEMGRGRIERNGRSGIRTIVGIHFVLTSSQPGHTGMPLPCTRGGGPRPKHLGPHPSRQSFGTTRRIRLNRSRKPLGLNP